MAITIIREPDDFQPSHSDGLYFVVESDKTTELKYRYVYYLYVNDTKVFEGKSTPNPEGKGIFDVQDILQTYTDNNPQVTTTDFVHKTEKFSRYTGKTNVAEYYIRVGEEYATGNTSSVVQYDGLDGVGIPAKFSTRKKVYSGTYPSNGLSYLPSVDINPFVLTGNPINYQQGLFLTDSPRIVDVYDSSYHTLSFLNYELGGGLISYPYKVRFDFYDETGTFISSAEYNNVTSNGGGPLDVLNDTMYDGGFFTGGDTEYNILNVGVGPKNIESFLPSNAKYYHVTLFGIDQSSSVACPEGYLPAYMQSCQFGYLIPVCVQSGLTSNDIYYYEDPETSQGECFQLYQYTTPNIPKFTASGGTFYQDCLDCTTENPAETPIFSQETSGSTPNLSAVSETFQFNIECDPDGFNNRTIMWRNRFGVYDYYKFTRKKTEGLDIEREMYKKSPVSWGDANPTKTQISRGVTDYFGRLTETHVINTGFVNAATMSFLESLYTTNDAYLIEPDGTLFPINITNTTFQRKNKGNRDLTNLELTYTFSNNIEIN